MNRIASLAAFTVLALVGGTALAAAAPNAVANDDFDLRKTPKNGSARVNAVDAGDLLTITKCQGRWCYAKVPGPDGWIRIEFLSPVDRYGEVYEDEPFSLDFDPEDDGYGRGGRDGGGRGGRAGGGFTIGGDDGFGDYDGGGRGGRGGRGDGNDGGGRGGKGGQGSGGEAKACFYADVGYAGGSFCVPAGNSIPNVGPQWNDRISSVRVFGGASAQVCADEYFGGDCTTWNQDIPNVGWQWNDTVTAIAVR